MFKVKTLNAISATGLNLLPKHLFEVGTNIADPDAILLRSHVMHDMSIPNSVKVIGRAGAGVNNIPVKALTEKGIPVINTPGANANAVRELVLAGMLLACRNICSAWNYVNSMAVDDHALNAEIEQNKKRFVGTELLGKTLGVIGLGSIGVKVANAACYLGLQVIGFDPTISVNRAWELSANVKQALNIEALLSQADFVTFHVPLSDETRNMLNEARFALLKPSAVLLNFARDGIIEKTALINALQHNKISAYVTDFPANELKQFNQVVALPHLGASTKEAEENCAVMIAKQVRQFLETGSIHNAVNFPQVELPPLTQGTRLTIVNANVPKMVAQISSKLADAGLNITSLVNQSRQEIAYTVIDLNDMLDGNIIENISSIPGVKQIRKIKPLQV